MAIKTEQINTGVVRGFEKIEELSFCQNRGKKAETFYKVEEFFKTKNTHLGSEIGTY